ncbi:MAG: glycosyltransferase involved in cell wall biosynthesis [Marinomonas primoryensis]
MNDIVLSILLPAYNYPEGIHKILSEISEANEDVKDKFEVVIYDNSSFENDVKREFEYYKNNIKEITYKHYYPELGPSDNWNQLISNSRGKYFILIHHDEFPLSDDFVVEVLKKIENNPSTDLFLLDCFLMNKSKRLITRHIPTWIRVFVIKFFPTYLFRRNVVGPTASLIIRKDLQPTFDKNLKWLLDVDEYFGLFRNKIKWIFCKDIQICSYIDRGNSLTSSLGDDIGSIWKKELIYLAGKYSIKSPWLAKWHVLHLVDIVGWSFMRLFTRNVNFILNRLGFYPISKEKVKKAFDDNC